MSEVNFSPWPWILDEKIPSIFLGSDGVDVGEACLPIHTRERWSVPQARLRQYANARLMMASPELLQSLRVMTELCRIKYGNLDKDVYAEILKAEALIAKATGEKEE